MKDSRPDPQVEEQRVQGGWTGGGALQDDGQPHEPPDNGSNHV